MNGKIVENTPGIRLCGFKISCSAWCQEIDYSLCCAHFEVRRDSGLVFALSDCLPNPCTAFPRPSWSMHFGDLTKANGQTK